MTTKPADPAVLTGEREADFHEKFCPEIERLLSPCIDIRAPYAKILVARLAGAAWQAASSQGRKSER